MNLTKNNLNPSDYNPIPDKPANYSAKLAIVGSAFTTFGDFLTTVAATIALEELENADLIAQQDRNSQQEKMLMMQKQIDQLKMKLEQLTKQ